jgi:GTPase SAR1 family protein
MGDFTFLVIGESKVGKSSIINNLCYNNYLYVNTNKGVVIVHCIEKKDIDNIPPIDGIIMVFDVSNINSYQLLYNWYPVYITVTKNVVLCGNKCDLNHRAVKYQSINLHTFNNIKYFDITSYDNLQKIYRPLLKNILGQDLICL